MEFFYSLRFILFNFFISPCSGIPCGRSLLLYPVVLSQFGHKIRFGEFSYNLISFVKSARDRSFFSGLSVPVLNCMGEELLTHDNNKDKVAMLYDGLDMK